MSRSPRAHRVASAVYFRGRKPSPAEGTSPPEWNREAAANVYEKGAAGGAPAAITAR